MIDKSLKSVLVFTGIYGLIACALLAGQVALAPPSAGRAQVADAGGSPASFASLISVASFDLASSE
jgi:hypothetical protein